jgi:hypothetical protein
VISYGKPRAKAAAIPTIVGSNPSLALPCRSHTTCLLAIMWLCEQPGVVEGRVRGWLPGMHSRPNRETTVWQV